MIPILAGLAATLVLSMGASFAVSALERWREKKRRYAHRCHRPFDLLREEVVVSEVAWQTPDSWVESRITDRRVRCRTCGLVHQFHTGELLHHEGTYEG